MNGNDQMKGMVAYRNGGKMWLGLQLVAWSLLLAGLMGCQKPASTAEGPTAQSQAPDTAAAAVQKEAAEPKEQSRPLEPVVVKVTGTSPKMVVEKNTVDLGEIGTDVKRSGQFKFTNAGKGTLKIITVNACCGVITKGVKAGQEYAPGEAGVLEFEFQGSAMPMTLNRPLHLQTNDPEQAVVTLTVKGTIVRRVECKPESMKLFLRKENAGCGDIVLKSLDGRPFSIKGFRVTADAITAAFDPNAQGTEFVLKPKADLEKLKENVQGQIQIELTHPECSRVGLFFDVLPEYTVSPPHIMMFGLKVGKPIQREDIWILSNYQDDFEIEAVVSKKGTIKLLEKTKVGNRYQLRIEVTPPEREGGATLLSDILAVKIKDGQTLFIPFRGFYSGS